jgi:hypothetical protein
MLDRKWRLSTKDEEEIPPLSGLADSFDGKGYLEEAYY